MKMMTALIAITLFACNSAHQEKTDHIHPSADTAMMSHSVTAKKLYADVKFDSRYDLSCGMPLTAALTDTAHYKGKVYGFCSPECREDFKKHADSLILKAK